MSNPTNLNSPALPIVGEPRHLRDEVLELDRAGFTRSEIARNLRLRQDEVRVLLRDAKHIKRYGATPAESGRHKLGVLSRSTLDQLRNVGDSVIMSKAEGRSRQNVHVLGKNRGWNVHVVSEGNTWRVVAVSKRPIPQRPERPKL